jgi:hypothetical protein
MKGTCSTRLATCLSAAALAAAGLTLASDCSFAQPTEQITVVPPFNNIHREVRPPDRIYLGINSLDQCDCRKARRSGLDVQGLVRARARRGDRTNGYRQLSALADRFLCKKPRRHQSCSPQKLYHDAVSPKERHEQNLARSQRPPSNLSQLQYCAPIDVDWIAAVTGALTKRC